MIPIITNYLMSTGVMLVLCEQGFKAFFLLLSRDCLKKGQNQEHYDGSHLERHLFEWLKLKSKAQLRRDSGHSTRVLNLETSQHDVMISLHC